MNVIVIGGGYAGMIAALRLAGKTRQHSITLINATDTFVERIRLHQLAAGEPQPHRSIPAMLGGRGIEFVQGRVIHLDADRREVVVQSAAETRSLSYDALVYALGSFVDAEAVPGARDYALTLGSVEKAQQMQAQLKANPGARVVLVGGGLTGIELATELADQYPDLSLTLLTRDRLGPNLSEKGRAYLLKGMARRRIDLREGVSVERFTADGVIASDGTRFPAEISLWAGAFGVPPLAREAGLAVNRAGQILIDDTLRSLSHPEIFAVGDAAASGLRMACATALPLGAQAADNLAALLNGDPLQPFRFGYLIRCISLGRHDGLVQRVNADDSPREQIVTGRAAAWIKEAICRSTVLGLQLERRIPGSYQWPHGAEVAPLVEASVQGA